MSESKRGSIRITSFEGGRRVTASKGSAVGYSADRRSALDAAKRQPMAESSTRPR